MTHNPATNRVPIIQDGVLGHDVHSLKSHSGSSLPLPDFPKLSLYVPPLPQFGSSQRTQIRSMPRCPSSRSSVFTIPIALWLIESSTKIRVAAVTRVVFTKASLPLPVSHLRMTNLR